MLRKLLLVLVLALTAAATSAAAPAATILVFGDSLSAGYGIAQDRGWVHLLARRLHEQGYGYSVANASISGETTTGGASRIEGALKAHKPDIVVLELGANDGLRGQSVDVIKENLEKMIDASRRAKARVLVLGMRLPPNYGRPYTRKFQQTFIDVSRERKTAFVPFMLEGFAEDTRLFQADRVHPTAEAQVVILDNIWDALKPLLRR